MYYELWDIETRNLLEDFDDLEEAIMAARELTDLNPGTYPENLALARVGGDGETVWPARGAAILLLSAEPEPHAQHGLRG